MVVAEVHPKTKHPIEQLTMNQIVAQLQAGSSSLAQRAQRACGVFPDTPILSMSGLIPVQDLRAGMRLITRSGMRLIKEVRQITLPALPVIQIKAGTLAPGIPSHDLMLPAGQKIALPLAVPHQSKPEASLLLRPRPKVLTAFNLLMQNINVQQQVFEDETIFQISLAEQDFFSAANTQVLSPH